MMIVFCFSHNNFKYISYVQDKGDVLLLSVGAEQRDLHRLLVEAHYVLTEEMHLHLIVENYERRNTQFTPQTLSELNVFSATGLTSLIPLQGICRNPEVKCNPF